MPAMDEVILLQALHGSARQIVRETGFLTRADHNCRTRPSPVTCLKRSPQAQAAAGFCLRQTRAWGLLTPLLTLIFSRWQIRMTRAETGSRAFRTGSTRQL